MADALISPAVGGAMWAAAAGAAAYSVKKVQEDLDESKIPLMGVMGAFVFAAQMINFSIPGTGSSGHLGGGLLLTILLGPYAGFITMVSILAIQALFFADGGLLALGSNIINLGFFACFVAYPLIYKPIIRKGYSSKRLFWGAMAAAVIGLQLGALGVVLETFFSGKTELPFSTFLLLMQPIHLVIGIVEGLVTAAVVAFIWQARPEIIEEKAAADRQGSFSLKKVLAVLAIAALLTGGILSWFASKNPDGLEWSVMQATGNKGLNTNGAVYNALALLQEKTAFLAGYTFKKEANTGSAGKSTNRPQADTDASVSGLLGGLMTLLLAVLAGTIIYFFKRRRRHIKEGN